MTTPEVHATPSPPFCSPKPVVAARHPRFVFFIVFVSGVRNISARPHGNVGGQPRAELRTTGSPSWRSWRGTALRSPPKSQVSDMPPLLNGDLVATIGRATSEKHLAGTPRPRPDFAGLLAMRPRSSRVRPADAQSSQVLLRWVRVPCGPSTGREVDRVHADRGRPGTPDGGVDVDLTRAHPR